MLTVEQRLAALQSELNSLRDTAKDATPSNLPDNLPRNRDGIPEFATVTLTLDHLFDKGDRFLRNKMLYSTESMPEAIANLMTYYGFVLGTPGVAARVLEIVGEAAKEEYNGGILVLWAPRNPHDAEDRGPVIEILMSTPSYYDLIEHPDFGKGSSLMASNELVSAVWAALDKRKAEDGAYPALSYLKMLEADYPEAPVVENPCDALSDINDVVSMGVASSPRSRCMEASNEATGGQQFGNLSDPNPFG